MPVEEDLPGPPAQVYPAVLKAIRELFRLTTAGTLWLDVLDADLATFSDSGQVTQTLFLNNMGTLPDIIIYRSNGHKVEREQEPWVNACLNTLEWLGQVAGRRIGPPRAYGMPLFPPRASAALCPSCGREYMYRVVMEWMAATAWAHGVVPSLLMDSGPEETARRSLEWKSEAGCVSMLAGVERLVGDQRIEIVEHNPLTWPRSPCPACGAVMGTRTWTVEGKPMSLVAGQTGV